MPVFLAPRLWSVLWLLFSCLAVCRGQTSPPTSEPATPIHTCRIILRGAAAEPFSLTEFRLECWPGGHIGGDTMVASDTGGADAGVTVRLGRSMLRYISSGGVAPTFVGVHPDLGIPRPRASPSSSSSSSYEPASLDGVGCDPLEDECEDWGIDFLDVPHLRLVDSVVSDVPLSGAGPLLQCLNCSIVTAQNLALRNLMPQPGQPALGAVRVTGLINSTLEGISCSQVRGALGWACILLQTLPGATIIMSNSSFGNNSVDKAPESEGYGDSNAYAKISGTGFSSGGSGGVVPLNLLTCTSSNSNPGTVHPYGAVLIATLLSSDECGESSSSVLVERTTMTNNTGGCGAGISVVAPGSCKSPGRLVRLAFRNSTFSGNAAALYGGGVYIFDPNTNVMNVSFSNASSLSFNTAGMQGGAAAIIGNSIGDLLVSNTHVFDNAAYGVRGPTGTTAYGEGGGLCISNSGHISSVTVNGSKFSRNKAGTHGGAIYATSMYLTIGAIQVEGASTLDDNQAEAGSGGAIHVWLESVGTLPDINITGQSVFSNNTAYLEGGAVYVGKKTLGSTNPRGQQIFLHGASFLNNMALTRHGGALSVRYNNGNVTALSISNSSFVSNTAACSGGALSLELRGDWTPFDGPPADGLVGNVTIAAHSIFANNSAAGSIGDSDCLLDDKDGLSAHGGAIFLGVHGIQQPLTITGGSSLVDNSALLAGGAIYTTKDSFQAGLLITGGSTVSRNKAGTLGGFIALLPGGLWGKKNFIIRFDGGSSATNNTAGNGGVVYASVTSALVNSAPANLSLQVVGSHITGNRAENGSGGALYVMDLGEACSFDLSVEDGSTVAWNRAFDTGGAFFISSREVKDVLITGASKVVGNSAGSSGGGLQIVDLSSGIRRFMIDGTSRIENNNARTGNGGAINLEVAGNVSLMSVAGGSVLSNNRAGGDGGALAINTNVLGITVNALLWDGGSMLTHNQAHGKGGGIYTKVSSAHILVADGCQWDSNTASGDGGAICIDVGVFSEARPIAASNLTFKGGSKIRRNSARNGGAVYVNGFVYHELRDGSTMELNTAEYDGGAAFFTQLPPYFLLESCRVNQNTAIRGSGGAFYLTTAQPWLPATAGGCPYCALPLNAVQAYVSNVSFDGNIAETADGGAFFIKPHETCCSSTNIALSVLNSRFTQNKAMGAGGAFAVFDASNTSARVSVTGTEFTGNTAGTVTGDFTTSVNFGGAFTIWRQPTDSAGNLTSLCQLHVADVSFHDNSCNGGSGGAVALIACSAQFRECNFTANRATLSGGAFASMQLPRTTATLGLTSSGSLVSSSGSSRRRMLLDGVVPDSSEAGTTPYKLKQPLLDSEAVVDISSQPEERLVRQAGGDRRRKLSPGDVYSLWENSRCFENPNWSLSVLGCDFHSNSADLEFGGGLYLYASTGAGHIHIDGSTFTDNTAKTQHAGAVFLASKGVGSALRVTNSVFDGNTAKAASAGALLTMLDQHACGALANVSLTRNQAATSGGACVLDVKSGGVLGIQDLRAGANVALAGGAGALQLKVQTDGLVEFGGCSFHGNKAAGNGGAVLLDGSCGSHVSLRDSSMTRNQAGLSGGALYASYAAQPARSTSGKLSASSAATSSPVASSCPPDTSPSSSPWSGQGHMWVDSVDFRENRATQKGGAVFVAPSSSVALSDLTMDNNTACGGGGSLAAEYCASLALSRSTIHNSHTTGSGGGFYAGGCKRVLFEFVNVTGNAAAAAGGGLMVSGSADEGSGLRAEPGQDATSSASAAYSSMVLHRVRVSSNAAGDSSSGSGMLGRCEVNVALQQTGRVGMGGGLFISGAVAGVLSRSNLTGHNEALFGSSLATTQRCYPANDTVGALTGNQQVAFPEEVRSWGRAWDELDQLAARSCWVLQLSDTLLPPLLPNATTKELPIWVDDFLASAFHAACSDEYQTKLQFTDETADSSFDNIRSNVVGRRLSDTRKRVQIPAQFTAGQVLSLVRDGAIAQPATATLKLRTQRLKDLANALDTCVTRDAATNLTTSELVNAALRVMPYLGLPATFIALPRALDSPPAQTSAGSDVRLQLRTGVVFNLTVQLYDMLQQRVTSDIGPATVTLALRPQPPGGGPYNATAADSSTLWLDPTIGLLDAGMDRSMTVPLTNGSATWIGVKAYAWPGRYSLVLNLSDMLPSYVKVAALVTEVEILPCAVGETLELTQTSYKATWTGCMTCPSGQYGLWVDSRLTLTDVTSRTGRGEEGGSLGAANGTMMARELRFLDDMNNTIHADNYSSCKLCPGNALCLGGAVIVPEPGYWHSSANSTLIHACPNTDACSSPPDNGRTRFPRWLDDKMGAQWDARTKLLAWCQLAWYDGGAVPGSGVWATYWQRHGLDDGSPAALPPGSLNLAELAAAARNTTALLTAEGTLTDQLGSTTLGETYTDCLLFGLPPSHPDSYMQQLCLEGYTGNLCAACAPGYYVDVNFNCKRCPDLARTIALGLISFFSSVVLVIFTTVTNFAESFRKRRRGQQQRQQGYNGPAAVERNTTPTDPVDLGDVVKVIVLHIQYLIIVTRLNVNYPSILMRCQAVFSTITGAENYIVFSPSCLKPESDSGGQALIQWLAGILTPCAVCLVSMFCWTLWYWYRGKAFRHLTAEVVTNGVHSAKAAVLSACRAVVAWRGRALHSSRATNDVQSLCSSESSAVVASKNLDPAGAKYVTLAVVKEVLPASPSGQYGGLCDHYRDVLHVVSFDGMDGGAGSPDATAAIMMAASAACSPLAPVDGGPAGLSPTGALPTAASAALVVNLDGVEGGCSAVAPEPPTSDSAGGPDQSLPSMHAAHHALDVSILPEDRLDRVSDVPGIIRLGGSSCGGGSGSGGREDSGDSFGSGDGGLGGGPPPALGHLHNRHMSVRWEAPTAVLPGGSGGGGPGGAIGYQPYQHYRNMSFQQDTWHRKMPRTMSNLRSASLNAAIKDKLHKLKSLAVSTQQTSQQTFSQVDKTMSLREQLGVVLMAAVFILYPTWAHAALSTFACYPIDDGTGPFPNGQLATWSYGYWVRDMQTQCYTGTHLRFYVPCGMAAVLVFCVLPPLLSFVFVWRVRNRLDDAHVHKVYGFLYKRYKPRYIWWETALQLETLILVTVVVLARGLDVSYQALLLLAVCTIILVINVSCAPLVSQLLVIMECISLATLSLTIILSLYFTINKGLNAAAENTLAIMIIIINTGLMLWFLYIASRRHWPSAVWKVAPKAQAVLRKLSSIGAVAGNNHHSRMALDKCSNGSSGSNPSSTNSLRSRFLRWALLGPCLTAWRNRVGAGRSDNSQPTSFSDGVGGSGGGLHMPHQVSYGGCSEEGSGRAETDSMTPAPLADPKGRDLARANMGQVHIQLEEGNSGYPPGYPATSDGDDGGYSEVGNGGIPAHRGW